MRTPLLLGSTYNPAIDGLRAVAVISVIINHFNSYYLPSGFLGVDVFFVISGYVITQSIFSRRQATFSAFMLGFFSRRIKRLAPALIFFIAITSVLISLFNPDPSKTLKTGITALFGASNLYLIHQATDYFGDSAKLNAFTHTWSLAIEEQFYLTFPVIILMSGLGKIQNGVFRFGSLLTALSIVSLTTFIYLSISAPQFAYFFMPARFWELAIGCLAFITQPYIFSNHEKQLSTIKVPLLITLLLVFCIPEDYLIASTIITTLLTAAILWAVNQKNNTPTILNQKTIVYIGKISYSLYLWHWGILVISKLTLGMHVWLIPIQVIAILLFSIFSYHFIESPLRKITWSKMDWITIFKGVSASTVCALLLFTILKPLNGALYAGRQPDLSSRGVESLTDIYLSSDKSATWTATKCVLLSNSDVGKDISIEHCAIGNPETASRRILVLGNSFSAAFVSSFEDLIKDHNYSIILTSSWGASPIPEIPNKTPWKEANKYYWGTIKPKLLGKLTSNDWVLLASDLATLLPTDSPDKRKELAILFKDGLENLSSDLKKRNIDLAVLHALPPVREVNCAPAATIPQWFTPFGGPCKFPKKDNSISRMQDLSSVLSSLQNSGVLHTIDLFDLFCPSEYCTYQSSNGVMLYRDVWSHPSVEAAILARPIFNKVLLSD